MLWDLAACSIGVPVSQAFHAPQVLSPQAMHLRDAEDWQQCREKHPAGLFPCILFWEWISAYSIGAHLEQILPSFSEDIWQYLGGIFDGHS